MAAGQSRNVVVCAASPPGAAADQVSGPVEWTGCPNGQLAYVVEAYMPYAGSKAFFDGLMTPFDSSVAAGIFGFGFGLVVFFYVLGLKGSILLRPFWGGRY